MQVNKAKECRICLLKKEKMKDYAESKNAVTYPPADSFNSAVATPIMADAPVPETETCLC